MISVFCDTEPSPPAGSGKRPRSSAPAKTIGALFLSDQGAGDSFLLVAAST